MPKDKAKCDIDPVCRMDLSGKEGKIGYDFEDVTYYFCSELCKDHFAKEPKRYARKAKVLTGGMPAGAIAESACFLSFLSPLRGES